MVSAGDRPRIVALLGPTGSGKTRGTLALAGLVPAGVELVSCDSQAVYRGLEIGTAKPLSVERAAVPHHGLDLVEPWEEFSAASFAAIADHAIEGIPPRGRVPLVVVGTGLWLRALLDGMFEGPGADPTVRAPLEARVAADGPEALHGELAQVDPEAAARIAPRDRVRIVRALEVYVLTGRTISEHHKRDRERPRRYDALLFGVTPPREELHRRVDARARAMFDEGLVEETRRLAADPRAAAKLRTVMGYREALQLIEGSIDREEAIRRTAIEHRHYAKRQLTWFRAVRGVEWLDWPLDPAPLAARIQRFAARSVS